MGCNGSAVLTPIASHGLLDKAIVAICLHCQGLFGVAADGSVQKLAGLPVGKLGPLSLPISETEWFNVGAGIARRIDLEKGSMTHVGRSRWSLCKAMVQCSSSMLVFHEHGLYRLNPNDGSSKKLGSSTWALVTSVVYDPRGDVAWAFHDWGLYRVASDGRYEQLGNRRWNLVKAAVWTPAGVLVLHEHGIERVSLEDGSVVQLSSEPWSQARAAVDAGDGTALVFHSRGLFKLDLSTGKHRQVASDGWSALRGLWPAEARAVNSPVSLLGARDPHAAAF